MQSCNPAKMAAEYGAMRRKGGKPIKGKKSTIGELMGAKRKPADDEGDED